MAQLGGHAQFIESRTTQIAHGDTPKEIGEILGRYNDGIAIRNVDWGVGNQLHPRGGRGQPRARPQHAVRPLPPPPDPGRPDDDHREEGRPAGPDDRDQLGLRRQLPEADQRAAVDLSLLTTRYGMNVRLVHPPEFELPADIVDQAGRERPPLAAAASSCMDDFDAGLPRRRHRLRQELGRHAHGEGRDRGRRDREEVHRLDHRRAADRHWPPRTRSTCTRCPPTGTSRSRTPSSTARTRSSTTRPRTGSTPRRP